FRGLKSTRRSGSRCRWGPCDWKKDAANSCCESCGWKGGVCHRLRLSSCGRRGESVVATLCQVAAAARDNRRETRRAALGPHLEKRGTPMNHTLAGCLIVAVALLPSAALAEVPATVEVHPERIDDVLTNPNMGFAD